MTLTEGTARVILFLTDNSQQKLLIICDFGAILLKGISYRKEQFLCRYLSVKCVVRC